MSLAEEPNFGGGADSIGTRSSRGTEMTLAGGLPVLGGAVLRRGGEGRPQSVPDLPNVRCIPAWGSPPDKFVGFFLDESWPHVLKGLARRLRPAFSRKALFPTASVMLQLVAASYTPRPSSWRA